MENYKKAYDNFTKYEKGGLYQDPSGNGKVRLYLLDVTVKSEDYNGTVQIPCLQVPLTKNWYLYTEFVNEFIVDSEDVMEVAVQIKEERINRIKLMCEIDY